MGPTWVMSGLDGPHVGPMNLAIRDGAFRSQAITWHNVDQIIWRQDPMS